MDFILRLRDYVNLNVTLNASVEAGVLTANKKSVALRETPGNIPTRYWDRGKIYEFNFQFLVKDPNFIKGNNAIHDIAEELDGLPRDSIVSSNGSFVFVKSEIYTTPNFVDENEHGGKIFTALFAAQLEK